MARPKLGESESKRLQMVITEDELKAVEDWQFSHRVSSKSEAMRRLVQVGLNATESMPDLTKNIHRILQIFEISGETLAAKMQSASNIDDWKEVALASVQVMGMMIDEATKASASVWGLAETNGSIVENPDVAAAIEAGKRTNKTVQNLREATRSDDLKPFQDWAEEQQK